MALDASNASLAGVAAGFANATASLLDNATTNGSATAMPSGVPMSISMPPLPRPGIFDAPSNPYLDGLDSGGGAMAAMMGSLSPAEQLQAQAFLVSEIIRATKSKAFEISMILLVGYALVLLFSAVLIVHIRYNRHLATKGDTTAARKIILPAFEPLLWTYVAITTAYIAFFGATIRADFMTVQSTFVTIEMAYSCKEVLYLLVPIYMMQKSLSTPALMRAFVITLFASFYTVPIVWVMQEYGTEDNGRLYYWILWISRWLTFLPFMYVCTWPPARASSRTLREYFVFYIIVQCFYFAACEIFRQGGGVDLGTAFGWASSGWVGVCPFFIWRVLKADTEHWRGIGKRAVELQMLFRRRGKIDERISAKGLHVLIEMHRKYIIDFANLDIQHRIGEGSNSIVFRGRLNSKQTAVAIKVYTPEFVNEETVAEFSHEAALCGALRHPNILLFHGMCVCPPTICLVTELCQGSLLDITRAVAAKSGTIRQRQQFLINIGYMIDAARAVAYLHSFSPAYVHRDIKPSNFLVDSEGTVKLTDFGASRTLGVRTPGMPINGAHLAIPVASSSTQTVLSSTQQPPVASRRGGHAHAPAGIQRSNPEYLAPEVIRGKHAGTAQYGEAADVYALAMTFWDVLYPGAQKYATSARAVVGTAPSTAADNQNQRESEIFESVFAGQRPYMDEHIYPPLRDLIQSAWHADPRRRPSTQSVVSVLETIQEETCAVYALELIDELDCSTGLKPGVQRLVDVAHVSFQGARAIEKMYALQHVSDEHEAVRLGNMLMDAGFMHHIKHARSFEYSAALFFFDEENVHLCQPLAMLEDGEQQDAFPPGKAGARPAAIGAAAGKYKLKRGGMSRRSEASSDRDQCDSNALMDNMAGLVCSCRKLGQHLESAQTSRSRMRLKFKSNDEKLVTARLLLDEPNNDFEAFQDQPK